MAIDPSMEPMLEVFIYETTTLLEQLDEILLESEKSKSFSEDSINEERPRRRPPPGRGRRERTPPS